MTPFAEHPLARWLVPGAAAALVGAVALAANHTASADPSLPSRTAAQLLVDLQQARLAGLSGTVVQTSNLGLPELPGTGGGGPGGGGSSSLTSMVSGTHTWRVWTAGPTQSRLALIGSLGESDVVRNGSDLWIWSSRDKSATHLTVPRHEEATDQSDRNPTDLPRTPQEAADRALAAISPTTSVTTSGTAVVAGRSVYGLVLRPKDTASLVAQVRISIDAQRHIPLRVQVYSTKTANPAFQVGFSQVSFAKPDATRFSFNPPPGTKVTQQALPKGGPSVKDQKAARATAQGVKTVGQGWTAVVVGTMPAKPAAGKQPAGEASGLGPWGAVLDRLPRVSGTWGSGRVLKGTLFTAVVTDDGRVAVGAVQPQRLYAALAAR